MVVRGLGFRGTLYRVGYEVWTLFGAQKNIHPEGKLLAFLRPVLLCHGLSFLRAVTWSLILGPSQGIPSVSLMYPKQRPILLESF